MQSTSLLKGYAVAGLVMAGGAFASAQMVTNDRWLPPPSGVYVDDGTTPIVFGASGSLLFPGATWFGFSNCILPPAAPTTLTTRTRMTGTVRQGTVDSFFDIFIDLDMVVGPVVGSPVEVVPIEIVALHLTSVNPIPLPSGVQIRENPGPPSLGQTTITPLGGGQYHIDSFFDVFTELSLDGGQTWNQGNRPAHMRLTSGPVPEPMTLALGGAALAAALRRRVRRA